MTTQYSIVGSGEDQFLTAFDASYDRPLVIHSSHPNFTRVKDAVEAGETPAASLFDPIETVREAFEALTDRVSVKGGTIYLDGDVIDNSITKAIVRWMQEDEKDWQPLVNFLDRIQANPSENSREALYSFLAANDYTINSDGFIVGYKAVRETAEDGVFQSINSGKKGDVQVNGEDADERPKQKVGDVVTMSRSKVDPDSSQYCSVGLHVAAWPYAESFGGYGGTKFRVLVDPRDVVAVPSDSSAQKMRVCRYLIDAVVENRDDRVLFSELDEVTPDSDEPDDLGAGRYDDEYGYDDDGGW